MNDLSYKAVIERLKKQREDEKAAFLSELEQLGKQHEKEREDLHNLLLKDQDQKTEQKIKEMEKELAEEVEATSLAIREKYKNEIPKGLNTNHIDEAWKEFVEKLKR